MIKKSIYWLYQKRVYLWITCLVTVMIFGAAVQFYSDWLNEPGYEWRIRIFLSLWVFSIVVFYLNAVAITLYSEKIALRYGNFGKGFLLVFFTVVTLFCCFIGISIMFSL